MILKNLKIKNILIGEKNPPVFFPDIGTFFNKDTILAKKLIEKLINSGAEVIKGEILHDPNIAIESGKTESYLNNKGKTVKENIRALIERKVVSLSKYENLFNFCKKKKVPFILSVYDFKGADFAYEIGASALKIASSNIVHKPLIEHLIKYNIPLILDTGKSSFDEITRTLEWFNKKKFKKLHIQHSPYAPPAHIKKQDLRMIQKLKDKFNFTVGLSDHYNGNEMLYASIALGANTIEKGIISSKTKDDQDVYHALNIEDFYEVNKKCKDIFLALGNSIRKLKKNEPRHEYRMGLIAKEFIAKNTIINLNKISFAFPKIGIPVEKTEWVVGKKAKNNIQKGKPIEWKNVNEAFSK